MSITRKATIFPKHAKSLEILGENIALAMLRRKISKSMMHRRTGLSRVTIRKITEGDPSVYPAPGGTHLSLNISDVDGRLDLALALEVAPFFQLEHHDAATIVTDVQSAVSTWQTVAADLGIPRREIEDTRAAFRIDP